MGFIVVLFLSYLTYAEPVIIGGKQNRTVDNLANGLYWAIVSGLIFCIELKIHVKATWRCLSNDSHASSRTNCAFTNPSYSYYFHWQMELGVRGSVKAFCGVIPCV